MGYDRRGQQVATLSGTYVPRQKITLGTVFRRQSRGTAFACGVDPVDSVGWFKTSNLFTSTDNVSLTTQPLPTGVASASNIAAVMRWGSSIYCQGVDGGGFVKIYKSQPPSAGVVSWTAVLTLTSGGGIPGAVAGSSWGSNDYLFALEYADPAGGPSLWRTPDGTTWTKVLGPIAGMRHFHNVAPDPFNPGHVYLTGGDGASHVLYRSTDYGATWTLLITDDNFQAVQISFRSDYVFFAGDVARCSVWVLDRNNPTVPMMASKNWHGHTPVPGGAPARGPFDDGVTTNASKTFTSAEATFTTADVGRFIRPTASGAWDEADGIYITAVTDAHTVTLNKNPLGSATAVGFWVDGDTFYRSAFYGSVDPATGIYYCIANDTTSGGNRAGLFYLPAIGERLELLEVMSQDTPGYMYQRAGKLWFHQGIHPLLATA